eukprot:3938500-Rhodomonas_salina.1
MLRTRRSGRFGSSPDCTCRHQHWWAELASFQICSPAACPVGIDGAGIAFSGPLERLVAPWRAGTAQRAGVRCALLSSLTYLAALDLGVESVVVPCGHAVSIRASIQYVKSAICKTPYRPNHDWRHSRCPVTDKTRWALLTLVALINDVLIGGAGTTALQARVERSTRLGGVD